MSTGSPRSGNPRGPRLGLRCAESPGRVHRHVGVRPIDSSRVDLASRRIVPADAQVQIDPTALPLDLIYLALAVVFTASLEGEQLGVPRERLKGSQHVPYCHAPSVATPVR